MIRRVLTLAAALLAPSAAHLRAQTLRHAYDHVLNYRAQSRFSLATGIPYLAIGEYAYGLSDRVTLGFMAGMTPNVAGYGLRVRTVLHQSDPGFRVYFCTPLYYYPNARISGQGAWWLTRPNINFEWMTRQGLRYKVGGSLIAVASQRALSGDAPDPLRFWDAVHAGISFPAGPVMTVQLEASLVTRGLQVTGTNWVGGLPVILVLGTSWAL